MDVSHLVHARGPNQHRHGSVDRSVARRTHLAALFGRPLELEIAFHDAPFETGMAG